MKGTVNKYNHDKMINIFTAGPHTKFAKVMFSEAPVILSGGGVGAWQGVCVVGRGMHGRGCMTGGVHGRGVCMVGEECVVGSMHGGGVYVQEMVTEACGTHPTGMHSCTCIDLQTINDHTTQTILLRGSVK